MTGEPVAAVSVETLPGPLGQRPLPFAAASPPARPCRQPVQPSRRDVVAGHPVTDRELAQAAWAEFVLTTDSYPTWKKKGFPSSSHWAKGKALLDQIGVAPAPTPSGLLWGARIDGEVYGRQDAPWDSGTWDLFEQHAGGKVKILHFGQPAPWKQAFARDPFDRCVARDALPLCSMSSESESLAAIATGYFDTSIKTWASAAQTWAGRILLRWDWEMNANPASPNTYAHAKQPAADYIAAWRHLRALLPANVEMVWCPNVIYPGSQPLGDRWPGAQYVNWLGMDGYNFGLNPLKPDVWRSFAQVFRPTYAELTRTQPGMPILICETASTEIGGDKAAWITGMWQTLPTMPQVKGMCWFNWNQGGADWQIESSTPATAAFRAGVPA